MLTVRGRGAGACAVFLSTVVSRVVSRHEGPLYVLSCVRQCVCGPCRQCAVPHGACRSARLGAREQFHNFHCFHMHVSCVPALSTRSPRHPRAHQADHRAPAPHPPRGLWCAVLHHRPTARSLGQRTPPLPRIRPLLRLHLRRQRRVHRALQRVLLLDEALACPWR